MRIAVVGSGISGLTAAYRLRAGHDVHVFEANGTPGGHANTVSLLEGDREIGVDTGFLVYNEHTYPGFTALLRELGVATQPSNMSLGITCTCGFASASHSYPAMAGMGREIVRAANLRLLLDIRRFHRVGKQLAADGEHETRSLDEWLAAKKFSGAFKRHYLVPLAASIWSTPASQVGSFPVTFLARFMDNHGLLTLGYGLQWRTVTGGSRTYVQRMVDSLPNGVHTNAPIRNISRSQDGVTLRLDGQPEMAFDKVIIATHSDQALAMLEDASATETASLKRIRYRTSTAVLHADTGVMPKRRFLWASWNYHPAQCDERWGPVTLTYYLNRLQSLDASNDYFVSVNPRKDPDPAKVIKQMTYAHPEYNKEAVTAQALLKMTNGERHTYFAGAYLGYGFHEDGYRSGAEAAAAILSGRRQPRAAEVVS